ncbi:hypothetical protein [Streptomyces sporangiiformans]|uniref:Uncharacterized protein n=1 Tax=Streptomyces sporangiiformans TaxID=2315329 RepID=A0A505D4Z1_9ACTN|nr:hypothetical protein [Streptomyces sporangiiformans]TPQ17927.1 hypothetical protein FGD71_033460 [Streptomyces sporangiiformans]
METNGHAFRPTPQQARAALADTEQVRASAAALSATPWPRWFAITLALFIAAIPPVYGGLLADPQWLLPGPVWGVIMLVMTAGYLALYGVAAANWRKKTGVALRLDVLPKRAVVPLAIGLPALLLGGPHAFRATGEPLWLFAASAAGAAVSIGFHLTFVRLHRKAS